MTRHAAMKAHRAPATSVKSAQDNFMAAQPLTKDDHLVRGFDKQLVKYGHQLIGLGGKVSLVIDPKSAGTRHAHYLRRAGQSMLIGIRQKPHPLPTLHDLRDDFFVLFVMRALLWRDGQKARLLGALEQIKQHFRLAPAQRDGRERFTNFIEFAITNLPATFIAMFELVF